MTTYARLPALGGDINTITFSGHSAGCQFSHTMQVIHSDIVKGASLMECGPYSTDLPDFHAPGVTTKSLETTAFTNIDAYSKTGDIDSLESFKKVAAYIVGGTEDNTVPMLAVEAVRDVYEHYGVEKYEFLKKDIGHDTRGSDPMGGLEYIYTQLGYITDGFKPASTDPYSVGQLIKFDQKEFIPSDWSFSDTTFADFGFYYVPDSCKDKKCHAHFVFHGCGGNAESFTQHFGYNEIAATNDIIMVYPDSRCWGYGDKDFDPKEYTKSGMVPTSIMNMVTRVATSREDEETASFVAEAVSAFFQ